MKIAFLGAGRMSGAMVKGLLKQKAVSRRDIACTGADDGTAEALSRQTGIAAIHDPEALLQNSDVVVAAFKPQQLENIDPRLGELTRGKLLLSILAGSRIQVLARKFPGARNIVRAMPNSPGQIGAGIIAFSFQNPPLEKDREAVETILGSLGETLELPEDRLDAVTAVSGSGPAYVFEFIAGLRDGGVEAGLDRGVAARLALATTMGAARLLAESGAEPETLRDQVASPGGTTLAGLQVMDGGGFRRLLHHTVLAAAQRSQELSGDTPDPKRTG